jgi:hypothetical protein
MSDEVTDEINYPLEKKLKPPIPKNMAGLIKNEHKMAHVPELVDYFIEERERLGLKDKPPTAYTFEKAIGEFRKLTKDTDHAKKAKKVIKFHKEPLPKVIPC